MKLQETLRSPILESILLVKLKFGKSELLGRASKEQKGC